MMDRKIAQDFADFLQAYIEKGDFSNPAILSEHIAETVVLYTPRFWRPITDRNWMIGILTMVPQAIENFTYHRRWIDGDEVIMEFSGNVVKLALQGIDIITLDDAGKIKELTVFVRPPNSLAALGEIEDRMLKEMFNVGTQDEYLAKQKND